MLRNSTSTASGFITALLIAPCCLIRATGKKYKHPYDRGAAANFAEVFGDVPWYLALLPSTRPPPAVVYPPEPEADVCHSGGSCGQVHNGSVGGISMTYNSGGHAGAQYAPETESASGPTSRRPLWENNHQHNSGCQNGDGGLVSDTFQQEERCKSV
jgi:hypothetical protein